MAGLRIASGFRFLSALSGGGSSIGIGATEVLSTATGPVSQLSSSLTGTLTFSKVSGSSNVSVSPTGVISLTSSLPADSTATFIVRVQNEVGDAVERSVTLKGVAPPVVIKAKFFGAATRFWGSTDRIFGEI